jgi:hypothetical protein
MVMANVKPTDISYAMFVNRLTQNAVKTTQIHSWWFKEIPRIDPTLRNLDPAPAYITVVNESSQRLFSSLTLQIRSLHRLLASMQQWYTSSRLQHLTLYQDCESSFLQ